MTGRRLEPTCRVAFFHARVSQRFILLPSKASTRVFCCRFASFRLGSVCAFSTTSCRLAFVVAHPFSHISEALFFRRVARHPAFQICSRSIVTACRTSGYSCSQSVPSVSLFYSLSSSGSHACCWFESPTRCPMTNQIQQVRRQSAPYHPIPISVRWRWEDPLRLFAL